MAVPRSKPSAEGAENILRPATDDQPMVVQDRALQELLGLPGVVVHRRDPEVAAKTFRPLKMTGTMSMTELRWLLGRIDEADLAAEPNAEGQSRPDRAS